MSLISLSDTKSGSGTTETQTTDLLALLMENIGRQAVEDDPEDLQRFQESIGLEVNRLQVADQARPAVEAVIELMAQHNKLIRTDHNAYAAELAAAMRMMVETIGQVSKTSQAAVHQLALIGKNLEEVTASNDATKLRSKLGVCLKMIREQSATLEAHTAEQVSTLKTFVTASTVGQQQASLLEEPVDPLTNLPTRVVAEKLIQDKLARKIDCMVGVIAINRFAGLKSRFGQHNVDALVRTVVNQLAQRVPEASTLCRWSPGSFLALTEIVGSFAETSQQWRRVNGLRVEKQIDDETRTAFVVLNTAIMVEHLRPLSSKRALIQNVERFVAAQSGEIAA